MSQPCHAPVMALSWRSFTPQMTETIAITLMALAHLNRGQTVPSALLKQAAALPEGAPLIVMIHGYRYCPSKDSHDPHRHILSLNPRLDGSRRLRSWPSELGISASGAEALGIAFGWSARGNLPAVYRRAAEVGQELAEVAAVLSEAAGRPVHMVGHSLGARVALQAMQAAQPGSIGRLILMAAAELRPQAEAAISSPAGRQAEVFNITSRENDIFDFFLELAVSGGRQRALGFGLPEPARNWLDLQIDAPEVRSALGSLGFPIAADTSRACHWSPYLREGMFDFYRVALSQPWALPIPLLRANLPVRQAPRWSRLLEPPRRAQSSSFSRA
ncbi:DUF726 domain-containing protein [Paracoccus sp. SCSIO 75233]|uniref:DUF726 domain-containing protein n=1 Tax=Paracoccus sp. SCSIO 75233 TaxID=3017782 RepID=UPI0022F084C7|nr:alpha/beta hydrolase [Paracoccus sp. SCSIO 75233]WBU53697.1 alpha/beta hydrolase [Paracoccus sp. SCSIO 75233]